MIVYRELSSLVRDLGIPAKTLYGVSNTVETHYHKVQLPKQDGGVRELSVPDPILKHIQRRITQLLLLPMPISRYASAYRYGCKHPAQCRAPRRPVRDFKAGYPAFL